MPGEKRGESIRCEERKEVSQTGEERKEVSQTGARSEKRWARGGVKKLSHLAKQVQNRIEDSSIYTSRREPTRREVRNIDMTQADSRREREVSQSQVKELNKTREPIRNGGLQNVWGAKNVEEARAEK